MTPRQHSGATATAPAPARQSLREAQKELTRQRLLDAGAAVFAEKGYAAATIDDIVVAAGATRATFYLHFRAKSDLVQQFMSNVRAVTEGVYDELEEAISTGSPEAIRGWLDRAVVYWGEIRGAATAWMEAAAVEPGLRAMKDSTFDYGVNAIVKGLRRRPGRGRLDARALQARAVLTLAQIDDLFYRWLRDGWDDLDEQVCLDVMTEMWVAAFAGGSKVKKGS